MLALRVWQTSVRAFRPVQLRCFAAAKPTVNLKFKLADGTERDVVAKEGDTLLDVAKDNKIDEVEGACEGTCCCSTCHMILDEKFYKTLGTPMEEELDMLDLALGLTPTSRLGCQIKVKKDMEGVVIQLPAEINNQMT